MHQLSPLCHYVPAHAVVYPVCHPYLGRHGQRGRAGVGHLHHRRLIVPHCHGPRHRRPRPQEGPPRRHGHLYAGTFIVFPRPLSDGLSGHPLPPRRGLRHICYGGQHHRRGHRPAEAARRRHRLLRPGQHAGFGSRPLLRHDPVQRRKLLLERIRVHRPGRTDLCVSRRHPFAGARLHGS